MGSGVDEPRLGSHFSGDHLQQGGDTTAAESGQGGAELGHAVLTARSVWDCSMALAKYLEHKADLGALVSQAMKA